MRKTHENSYESKQSWAKFICATVFVHVRAIVWILWFDSFVPDSFLLIVPRPIRYCSDTNDTNVLSVKVDPQTDPHARISS